jgi:hypothetical protein
MSGAGSVTSAKALTKATLNVEAIAGRGSPRRSSEIPRVPPE